MKSNICIYFDAIVKISSLNNIIGKSSLDSLYEFFITNNINYRVIGNYKNSGKIMVGKEISCDMVSNVLEIGSDGGIAHAITVNGFEVKIKINNESEINKKLISLGIIEPLKYYIFNSYDLGE